jgi:hypothetical protein
MQNNLNSESMGMFQMVVMMSLITEKISDKDGA